jgi:alpha-mannosidase
MHTDLTVHMVANAHIDPVWLWQWQRGSDEALATCRAACHLLDDHPDVVFTRGEAWVYEQVRSLDPPLFERIRAHVEAGRWEVVGGWWVQPDVNLPAEDAILKTAQLGHAWFRRHLGVDAVPVAYNVDSFGHGAYLPRMLVRLGQPYYVMMRPGPHEKELPSSLFRWRSPDGHEALTFRVAGYVCNGPGYGLEEHVHWAVDAAPDGIGHVMCFYGVGDHGGGPTRAAVQWLSDHQDFAPGVRLEFSSPGRFFAQVEPLRERCPVVTGELQMHAIGCYSVCGDLKRRIRRAELAAVDAERLLEAAPGPPEARLDELLRSAWEAICFNQFHDILPGSSIPEAVDAARADIGAARSAVDRVAHALLRGRDGPAARCGVEGHRLHVVNRSPRPWAGTVECELWLDWESWQHHFQDAHATIVPHQCAEPSSLMIEKGAGPIPRVLFPVSLEPGGHAVLRVVHGEAAPAEPAGGQPRFDDGVLQNSALCVAFGPEGIARVTHPGSPELLAGPLSLLCLEDDSDTWSHGLDRFAGPVRSEAQFADPVPVEDGVLRTTVRLDGWVGDTDLMLFVALERNEPVIHLRLTTNYCERMTVLKAAVALPGPASTRRDLVAGGWLDRPLDEREYPVHHGLLVRGAHGALGLVTPDSFAADCSPQAVRPTLIRNSLHAMHNAGRALLAGVPRLCEWFGTDEGPQEVRWALAFDAFAAEGAVQALIDRYQRPPYCWDDYAGGSRLDRFDVGSGA